MKRILLTAGSKLPATYIAALQKLGAETVVAEGAADAADFDGLVLCGGGDPEPALYGQKNQGSYGIDPLRDRLELSCIHSFLKREKPILGICRGMQLLNVAFGGSLHQHLTNAQLHLAPGEEVSHPLQTDGFIKKLYGRRLMVNSSHHQGIDRLGRGLIPAAWAEDGLVEAFLHQRLPLIGLQFHPERMEEGAKLLELFLQTC